jgi:tRNA (cytidine/uridine-2'-O-)-methyltransferase
MFHVVLVAPEIPPNTGNIARLCLASGATLHLVEPLGFSLDDRALKRAGLDYWEQVEVRIWKSLQLLEGAVGPEARFFYATTKGKRPYFEVRYEKGDYLVFGRETKGLPEPLLRANADKLITIPMTAKARSLNLATAVAIVLYDAIRQRLELGDRFAAIG